MMLAGKPARLLHLAKHPSDHRPQRILHDLIVRNQAFWSIVGHRAQPVTLGGSGSSRVDLVRAGQIARESSSDGKFLSALHANELVHDRSDLAAVDEIPAMDADEAVAAKDSVG